ncbi:hypothetical protein KF728_13270 [Candidatus Obscuribacterales bacterium]|nr:hypothetical protein [Candidatus Obscuribacterales bacterium]
MLATKSWTVSFAKCAITLSLLACVSGCTPADENATTKTPATKTPESSQTQNAQDADKQTTLLSRIVINPPAFNHPAVSEATIIAAKNAINNLPEPLRKKLDESNARLIIAPNMIDRWPDSVKDLPESDPAPTLAEQPGRIYGQDMCLYERPKKRGTTDLGDARAPVFLQLHVGDMCFQVLDDMDGAMKISKDPELRKEWEEDKKNIPKDAQPKVANFMKLDDWGPRETCAELFGSMMGGRNENTENLYKYFPRVKQWLITQMGITKQF